MPDLRASRPAARASTAPGSRLRDLAAEINTRADLTKAQQLDLTMRLELELARSKTAPDAVRLLRRLRARHDILAFTARKIEQLLSAAPERRALSRTGGLVSVGSGSAAGPAAAAENVELEQLRKAAAGEDADAKFALGRLYEIGSQVGQDDRQAGAVLAGLHVRARSWCGA